MQIQELNQMSRADAYATLMQCCAATRWIDEVLEMRPYSSVKVLLHAAEVCWASMKEPDYLEAFDGHPKIGDPASLKAKYVSTHTMASNEQASVQQASEKIIMDFASCNQAYEDKFGFIFIICATGKSADEMLSSIRARLVNNRDKELQIAAIEQGKITSLRIEKLFD
jgi:2-oxo-4-hydroxy-4-carboxy-5-ureidoimidazoline decarboxylase